MAMVFVVVVASVVGVAGAGIIVIVAVVGGSVV